MANAPSSAGQRSCLAIALGTVALLVAQPLAQKVSADPAPLAKFGWTVNGTADAATQIGNVLYVGGRFTRVSPFDAMLGSIYGLSTLTGEPTGVLPLVDGQVSALEPDGIGGYYIGGNFTMVAGQSRNGLARIRADGTVDPDFLPSLGPPSFVTSLARDGARLFLTGSFNSVSGAPRSGLAAVDGSTGSVAAWVPAVSGHKAVLASGRLIVLGSTGQLMVGATALDLETAAVIWSRTLGRDSIKPLTHYSVVNDVIVAGSRVIVGGRFGSTSGFGQPTCAGTLAWLDVTSGVVDTTWSPSTLDCGEVMALATNAGTLFVGGSFARLGGQTRTNAASVDLATGSVLEWVPEPNGAVSALAASSGGSVYLGGQFTTVAGQPREGLAEIGGSQTLTAWTANAYPQLVNEIVPTDGGSVVIGGSSAVSGGAARGNLAAFDVTTGALLDWQPSADAPITAMTSSNGAVFVGGSFESVSGTPRKNLAAIDAMSAAVLSWDSSSPIPLNVLSLLAHENYVYVSGYFPSSLRRLHRTSGALDAEWVPAIGFTPQAMLAHESWLIVGGSGTLSYPFGLAAIDLATGQLAPWYPMTAGGRVAALARADDTLFVGGTATSFSGPPHAYLGAFDLRTGLPTRWAPEADGPVTALAVADRVVVVGGTFATLAGQPRQGLGAVTFSGAPTPWTPDHGAPKIFVVGASDVMLLGTVRSPLVFLSEISTFALSGAPRPSNLQATVTDSTVSLNWSEPGGVTPMAYRIEAGTRPGASDLGEFLVGGTITSLSTLAPNGNYFARVRAVLTADEPATEPSNEVLITVGCTAPPPPPAGLYVQLSGTHVTLHWTASSPTARHVLELGSTLGSTNLATIPLPAGQETFAADAPPRTYFARVRAANACGTSGPSGEIAFTVGATVPLPGAPTDLNAIVNGAILTLVWTAPPEPVIGYVLEAGSAAGLADLATIPIGVTPSLQVPGVPTGTYFVRVRAITAAGVGPPSTDVVVVVP